ncbi:MAG: immunoglobulin domain-containing protein, partial [Tannerella sp.]|nr:immunoglobulin domain-containing protein [Tannerella sp.]
MNAYFIIFENTILRTSLRIMMAMAIMLSVANVDGMAQIKPPLTLPLITSQPSDVEATEGDEVSFSVETITLVKPEIMSFEWHQVGFISRTPLSTSSTLRIKNVSIRDAGKYYCIVKINPARNGYLSEETSHEATLKVNPGIKGDPPELSGSPLPDGIVGVKYYVELNAKGTAPISWSIYKGELPGGLSLNASTGVISGEPKSAGNFSFVVRVTNAFGENTREYGIRIESPVAPPSIINHPSDQSVVENETAVFSVNATGSDLSYQWQVLAPRSLLGWQNVVNDDQIRPRAYSGATTDVLTITNILPIYDGNQY